MAQWEYQNMTYPRLLLPHHSLSLAASPFHPFFSSPGFFNREHICCRNSTEGHVIPPWHSWLSRQTDSQANLSQKVPREPKSVTGLIWYQGGWSQKNGSTCPRKTHIMILGIIFILFGICLVQMWSAASSTWSAGNNAKMWFSGYKQTDDVW